VSAASKALREERNNASYTNNERHHWHHFCVTTLTGPTRSSYSSKLGVALLDTMATLHIIMSNINLVWDIVILTSA
jgi:hypothetical protein